MKNEKKTLLAIFTSFFALSAILMYMMIRKDVTERESLDKKINQYQDRQAVEANWPKVEIRARE